MHIFYIYGARPMSAATTSCFFNAVGPPATRVLYVLASSAFLASFTAAIFNRSASARRVTSAAAAAVALARSPDGLYSDSLMSVTAGPVVSLFADARFFLGLSTAAEHHGRRPSSPTPRRHQAARGHAASGAPPAR